MSGESAEQAEKRRRVHALLDRLGLDTLVLRSPQNIAWYTGGARTHILLLADVGVADLVITRDGERLIAPVNEAPRLAAEELAGLAPEITVVDWASDRLSDLPAGDRVGVDVPTTGRRAVGADVVAMRQRLTPAEVERYAALGRDAAEAMTVACRSLRASDSEWSAAAALTGELTRRGADPIVVLVAGADRLAVHRHPLPTGGPVGPLVMLVACARRDGLVANLTRLVSFGLVPDEVADSYARLLAVESTYLDATVPGARVGDVFAAGASAYGAHGFPPDEWTRHHQGGPCGYASRDSIATARSSELVALRQAFAWNPSAPSIKVEDTVVATETGCRVLTVDPEWPVVHVGGRDRPQLLELA